jgi:O-antigen ligase
MTHSKASLAFLPVAIAAGCLYRIGWQRGIDRAILTVAALIVASLLGILVFAEWGHISRTLTDPTELTGRTAIWQGEIAFIRDHFLLGSGFGSFSDTGAVSLLHNYVADTWVQNISQGHNGYLQILVTTGTIGFALAMTALVFLPAREFWRFDPANVAVRAVLFAIFVFMVLHNFLETDFLEGDDPAWVALVLAALRKLSPGNRKEPSRAAA